MWFLRFCGVGMEILSKWVLSMGLSIPSCAVGFRNGEWREEADWRACRDGGWNVDCRGTGGGGGGEYVPDLFVESAAVAGGDSEA